MSKLVLFALLGVVYATATMAATSPETDGTEGELITNITNFELFDFNIGGFQGLLFGDVGYSHAADYSTENGTMLRAMRRRMMHRNSSDVPVPSDLMFGDIMMVYRSNKVSDMPAQNFTLVTYKLTRADSEENCHDVDLTFDLVSVIKLHGYAKVCTENGSWSVVARPCISVFGQDLGCTEIKLSPGNAKYCYKFNAWIANAELCAEVVNSCLNFSGEGCAFGSCKNFEAQAFCW